MTTVSKVSGLKCGPEPFQEASWATDKKHITIGLQPQRKGGVAENRVIPEAPSFREDLLSVARE